MDPWSTLDFFSKSDLPQQFWSKLMQIDDFKSFYNLQGASKKIEVGILRYLNAVLYRYIE